MAISKKFPYRAALVACAGCLKVGGGPACPYGCLGCGACEAACRFDAIHVNPDGVAVVTEEKCVACGQCVRACPRHIIRLHECAGFIAVKCSNRDPGAQTRLQCGRGCVGCGLCEKLCTASAVRFVENCAVIDEDLCLSCGMCAVKCPRHAIRDLRGVLTAP